MPIVTIMQAMSRRLLQLYAGLLLYGFSMALQVRATLGLGPWDVFHEGVADRTGLSFGTVVIVTSVAVLLLWIPLRHAEAVKDETGVELRESSGHGLHSRSMWH